MGTNGSNSVLVEVSKAFHTREVSSPKSGTRIERSVHRIALEQARAHRRLGRLPSKETKLRSEVLACAANMGFALELYLKAQTIVGSGMLITGHDLVKIYEQFPVFLKTEADKRLVKMLAKNQHGEAVAIAFMTSPNPPGKPAEAAFPQEGSPQNFKEALGRINEMFVVARYFYDRVGSAKWVSFRYHFGLSDMCCEILDSIIEDYNRGFFKATPA